MGTLELTPEPLHGMGMLLAFTWTPDPKKIRGVKPQFQYDECVSTLCNLNMCCYDFVVSPELNVNGNIHFHGILDIKDKVKWYKKVLPSFKYMGFVLVKPNPDTKWKWYIFKDKDLMSKLLKNYPFTPSPKVLSKRGLLVSQYL